VVSNTGYGKDLAAGMRKGIPAEQTWMDKIDKIDFFVLDAIKANELWVLSRSQVYDLIALNEHVYSTRRTLISDSYTSTGT
jgi:hypothetical protein